MANQHLVRALIAREDVAQVRRALIEDGDVPADHIAEGEPEAADYRDEDADLDLSRMIRSYHKWGILGAVIGAVLALLLVLVLPPLRAWLPYSLILVFGGAWGGGIAAASRGVQTTKREDDMGEDIHHVGPDDARRLRLVTVTVDRDRERVVRVLQRHGATLLDSHQPRVGRGPDARPANPGQTPHSGDHRD